MVWFSSVSVSTWSFNLCMMIPLHWLCHLPCPQTRQTRSIGGGWSTSAGKSRCWAAPACPRSSFTWLRWTRASSGTALPCWLAAVSVAARVMPRKCCCVISVTVVITCTAWSLPWRSVECVRVLCMCVLCACVCPHMYTWGHCMCAWALCVCVCVWTEANTSFSCHHHIAVCDALFCGKLYLCGWCVSHRKFHPETGSVQIVVPSSQHPALARTDDGHSARWRTRKKRWNLCSFKMP